MVQSRDLCYPFKKITAKDLQQLYDDHFAGFFGFFNKVEIEGFDESGPGRFQISSPQDVSSFWKSLKRGGACKQDKDFCAWCASTSNQCRLPV